MTERLVLQLLQKILMAGLCLVPTLAAAQTPAQPAGSSTHPADSAAALPKSVSPRTVAAFAAPSVCAVCIHAHMDFLASDALRGRGSATPDEWVAATYIGAQLEQYGIAPAGDNGTYIQRATILQSKLKAAPALRYGAGSNESALAYGTDFAVRYLSKLKAQGPLQRIDADALADPDKANVAKGAVVLVLGKNPEKVRSVMYVTLSAGQMALAAPDEEMKQRWQEMTKDFPRPPKHLEGTQGGMGFDDFGNAILLSNAALARLKDVPDGTLFAFESEAGETEKSYTWNAVGKIAGRDPGLRESVVLLSAHLDHLGVGAGVNGDSIYNGADDDASGTTAVLELARALALGARPRRTVVFALFGSEEAGGLGSTWFREHPPVPLDHIAANLEFEMLGRPDPKYPHDALWLTGWERSNLGPALAAHGARLVADQRPEEQFFMRSDNYVLAKKGVVAQTVSSFGLHKDYHQPSDDLAHIDFQHMTTAIGSMVRPVEWLVNSEFVPRWKAGKKP